MDEATTAKIAALNAHAWRTFTGCCVVISQGVEALDNMPSVSDQVQRYTAFTPDDDPYGENDFGSFQHAEVTIFWNIDAYDVDLNMHSPDESDPTLTTRVLTIMLTEEY